MYEEGHHGTSRSLLTFGEKYRRVQKAVEAALGADRRHFDFTRRGSARRAARPQRGRRQAARVLALELLPQDIAELCSDAAVPATAALLAIDSEQARAATAAGLTVDLAQFTRSQSRPDVYYTLFDHASQRQIHTVLHRLVPALEPHAAAA